MDERTAIVSRLFVALGLILLIPAAIFLQLLRINVIEGENLRELWSSQTIHYITIPAQRGAIYDINGTQLASNSVAYRIAVDPGAPGARMDQFEELARILSNYTGRPPSYYMSRIRNAPARSRYVVLERSINVAAWEEITALNARGVIREEEFRRRYGFDALASHLIGYVNHNLEGMGGLENRYNETLSGTDGLQQVRRDRSNRIFAYVGAPRKQPVQGHSLHTTIDSFIQAIAEEELREGVARTRSNYGTAIVMDPKTGAIRAMANFPDFNPNNPGSGERANRRNYAVADMVEPGSTFKLVAAVAAVEQGAVDFDEKFETPENGQRLIHGQMMRDHDPLGTLDFTQAIARSSNIAVSEIAMRLKPEIFYQYARNMGFGTPTSIDLPNEEAGRLQKPYEWSRVTLPWMSIGYEVQATPIQLLQAYAAFANGGVMMRPYVVERITNEFGETVQMQRPSRVRSIARPETIRKLKPVFREVVSDSGTAGWAEVEGLNIAGKTGTAQKFIDGRYRNAYRASFVGFFPVEDPKYAVLVMLDEPRTSYYGGFTAGQIFREIATRIAGLDSDVRRSVTPPEAGEEAPGDYAPAVVGLDRDSALRLLSGLRIRYSSSGEGRYVLSQSPSPGEKISRGERLELRIGTPGEERGEDELITVPELRGLSMRQASSLLGQAGLEVERIGSGTVYNQFPQAGEKMRQGRSVTIRGRIRQFQPQSVSITASN